MYRFATDGPLDIEEFRARLRKMTDAQLLRYGKAARYMCSPDAYFGKGPHETFVIQLRECRAEWKRPKGRQAHLRVWVLYSRLLRHAAREIFVMGTDTGRPERRDRQEIFEPHLTQFEQRLRVYKCCPCNPLHVAYASYDLRPVQDSCKQNYSSVGTCPSTTYEP